MSDLPTDPNTAAPQEPYKVLARKYRPSSFAGLIGQDSLVRTLTNAIEAGRLAHAFVLTGVRGIGKTTTARIIAKSLNCIGPDGEGGPTTTPCGTCAHCVAIAEDRDVDVIEMDAASRTGVDDIRELLEGVRYRPVSARYKVYIIDEVHMLSANAFNALLKTLEEPPAHVIFIFATTEIRKVPVTVLSRCQRFDLRRVDQAVLEAHFKTIAEKEEIAAEPAALAMIARAADGSVRDGLSLLDQAIALGGGTVSEETVAGMLGLADRTQIFDLMDQLMAGHVGEALTTVGDLYAKGADPAVMLQDLLELAHWLTRAKLVPQATEDPGVPEVERVRGREMCEKLSIPVLARAWQILLKGLDETRYAPQPMQAAEMVLIRLAHASGLPTPGDLVRQLEAAPAEQGEGQSAPTPSAPGDRPRARTQSSGGGGSRAEAAEAPREQPAEAPEEPRSDARPESLREIVALLQSHREARLAALIVNYVQLVRLESGRLEFRPAENAPGDLAGTLGRALTQVTGERWMVTVSSAPGEPTLAEAEAAEDARARDAVMSEALVQAVIDAFPGASIRDIRGVPAEDEAAAGAEDAPEAEGVDEDALDDFLSNGDDTP